VGDLVVMKPLAHVRERPADSLLHVLDAADLSLGNLEVPLTALQDPQRLDVVLRGDAALIPDLTRLGVRALGLANNHCGDHGWTALRGLADELQRRGFSPSVSARTWRPRSGPSCAEPANSTWRSCRPPAWAWSAPLRRPTGRAWPGSAYPRRSSP
jgi:hypothetical protein